MNKSITVLASLLLVLAIALPAAALPAKGTAAPDFVLQDLSGENSVKLADLQGKVVYIDFWASWCVPCRRAFPEVMELHQEFGEQGFEVLAVSLDRTVSAAKGFVAKIKPEFTILFDEGSTVARRYGVRSIPAGLLLDTEGKVVWTAVGFDPKEIPHLKSLIVENLKSVEGAKRVDGTEKTDGTL